MSTSFDPGRGYEDPSRRYESQLPGATRGPASKQGAGESSSAGRYSRIEGDPLKTITSRAFAGMTPRTQGLKELLSVLRDLQSFDGTLWIEGVSGESISHKFDSRQFRSLPPEMQAQRRQVVSKIFENPSQFHAVHNKKNNIIHHAPNAPASHVQQIKQQNPTATVVEVSQEEWTEFCTALSESNKGTKSQDKKETRERPKERTPSQNAMPQQNSSQSTRDTERREKAAEKERAANEASMAAGQKVGHGSFSEQMKVEKRQAEKDRIAEKRDEKRFEIRKDLKK